MTGSNRHSRTCWPSLRSAATRWRRPGRKWRGYRRNCWVRDTNADLSNWPGVGFFCYDFHPFNGIPKARARITVEDCLQNEPNLFNLVLLAAKRARRLANGAEATVEWENDKPTVVEMREEPEEPIQQPVSELDMPSDFRAPQLGLGD